MTAIPLENLTTAEKVQLTLWMNDIAAIAGNSVSGRVRNREPRLRVHPIPQEGDGHAAWTTGEWINISRDLLAADPKLRRYLIAHELGHDEGWHDAIGFAAAIAVAFGLGTTISLLSLAAIVPSLQSASVTLMGVATIAGRKTMCFEWEADRRGARMTSVQAMTDGIDLVIPLRSPNLRAFYSNKKERLNGLKPSWFSP